MKVDEAEKDKEPAMKAIEGFFHPLIWLLDLILPTTWIPELAIPMLLVGFYYSLKFCVAVVDSF